MLCSCGASSTSYLKVYEVGMGSSQQHIHSFFQQRFCTVTNANTNTHTTARELYNIHLYRGDSGTGGKEVV